MDSKGFCEGFIIEWHHNNQILLLFIVFLCCCCCCGHCICIGDCDCHCHCRRYYSYHLFDCNGVGEYCYYQYGLSFDHYYCARELIIIVLWKYSMSILT